MGLVAAGITPSAWKIKVTKVGRSVRPPDLFVLPSYKESSLSLVVLILFAFSNSFSLQVF